MKPKWMPKPLKKNIKKVIQISTPFLFSFWHDLGSSLVACFGARTSDFIGRGGGFVGSAFFTNVPKIYETNFKNQ